MGWSSRAPPYPTDRSRRQHCDALVADWQVEALPDSAQWANAFVVSNCARRLCNDPRCSQHVLLQGASLETRLNWEAHIRLCIDALRSLEAAPYVASSS